MRDGQSMAERATVPRERRPGESSRTRTLAEVTALAGTEIVLVCGSKIPRAATICDRPETERVP
jgi:hypothetical protein